MSDGPPPPPHNLEAERSLLGSLLLDPGAITLVRELVRPEDFYTQKHQQIYTAAQAVSARHGDVDIVTVAAELHGEHDLAALVADVPTAFHVEHYAEIVVRASQLRRLAGVASRLARDVYAPQADPDVALAQAQRALLELGREDADRTWLSAADLSQASDRDMTASIERVAQGGSVTLGLGLRVLDPYLAIQPGHVLFLGAETGVGKTALVLNWIRRWCTQGVGVALAPFEMGGLEIWRRLEANVADIWATRLLKAELLEGEAPRWVKANAELQTWPLWVLNGEVPTIETLTTQTEALMVRAPVGVLCVDYMQLMPGSSPGAGRHQEVSLIARGLKTLARSLGVVVIAVSSIRRGEGDVISRLKESGDIEFAADWVLSLDGSPSEIEPVVQRTITIQKGRHGQSGITQVVEFDRPHMRFALDACRHLGV